MESARISRSALLPAAGGLLCFLSFPPANLGWLAWLAYVPLLVFVARARSAAGAFAGGFLAGFVQFFGLLLWIPAVLVHYGGVPRYGSWLLYVLLCIMEAAYPAVASTLTHRLIRLRGGLSLLAFPVVFVSLEWLRTYLVFGGFPWLLTGYSQTAYPGLMQIADVTGVYGVTFLVAFVNASLAFALVFRMRPWKVLIPVLVGLVLVVGVLAYGGQALQKWRRVRPEHTVAMLQGNISFDEPAGRIAWKAREGYSRMVEGLGAEKPDLLVLPEAPGIYSFERDGEYRERITALARQFRFGMILNSIRFGEETGAPAYYNSAYFLNGIGEVRGVYDKIHLVPFGEYIPARSLFFFAETITRDVGGFSAGQSYEIAQVAGKPANSIICFEAVFPRLVSEFVRRGSQLIVNLTNDGWYGDTAAPHQHLAMAQWRAVENRRYLLRATNSGISAVIAPTGEIRARTPLLREAVCSGEFAFIAEDTLYTRHGDWFALACAIITGFALLAILPLLRGRDGGGDENLGGRKE